MLRFPILALLAAAACGASSVAEKAVTDRVILPGAAVRDLLNQCSRSAPQAGEGTWQPAEADIDRLEALLPAALAAAPQAQGEDFSQLLTRWRRQYVGMVRGGRRYVYGNFLAGGPDEDPPQWRTQAAIVCDGGPPFFGVELDVEAGRITHLAFNGSA